MIAVTVIVCSFFLRLGFWQLSRADEKKNMIAQEQLWENKAPIEWPKGKQLPRQYQRLIIEGRYLGSIWLLDNQHHEHQFGYHVLSPLLLADGGVVFVDRGWIPGAHGRRRVPDVINPSGLVHVRGMAYFPNQNQWVLGPNAEALSNHVTIIEKIDEKMLSHLLQKKVYPFIIRLDAREAHGFIREWAVVSMPPQRHLAYAVQWFAMAAIVLIIFLALNVKKKND